MSSKHLVTFGLLATLLLAGCPNTEAPGFNLFASPTGDAVVVTADGTRAFAVRTEANRVHVIDLAAGSPTQFEVVASIAVGIDPVSLALRPGENELWVSNHVSDSVSVIDIVPGSATQYSVVDTVQSWDAFFVTTFDEPVGIAFANADKAYVALSSRNQIAVVDANTRSVTKFVPISAQDPRAIRVANGSLYVLAFESMNQSELSACPIQANLNQLDAVLGVGFNIPIDLSSPPDCTFDLLHFVDFLGNPNVPSATKNIVIDPDVPDRDLFVLSTADESVQTVVSGLGTLLYGIAITNGGKVFVTQTDARNEVNGCEYQSCGESGPKNNLVQLDNKMFVNELSVLQCFSGTCTQPTQVEIDPTPGHANALSTPYGIQASDDGSTLVAVASGTSRLFTVNAASNQLLGTLDLGSGDSLGQQIPRALALISDAQGAPWRAIVHNTLAGSLAVVDVTNPAVPALLEEIALPASSIAPPIERGRIAFNNAFASTSGNFSCASCHPDAHTDQLLWRIGGACFHAGCTGDDEARSTMPIRGLRDTLPLHWDGTLGDPFGGPNGAVGDGADGGANCTLGGPDGDIPCFRQLVNASLSGVMCDQVGGCAVGSSGLPGLLADDERTDMAHFLGAVSYPPARSRRLDESLSTAALGGFADFFIDHGAGNQLLQQQSVSTCGDTDVGCHSLPLTSGTNSGQLGGFDVPTMRGLNDRFVHFSNGLTSSEETLVFARDPQQAVDDTGLGGFFEGLLSLAVDLVGIPDAVPAWDPVNVGYDEATTFAASFAFFDPVYGVGPTRMFQMVEEASTGFAGAYGRQVTLNPSTAPLASVALLLDLLEDSDAKGLVNLKAEGLRNGQPATLQFVDGHYAGKDGDPQLTRAELLAEVTAETTLVTATAYARSRVRPGALLQPLISPRALGPVPQLPELSGASPTEPIQVAGVRVECPEISADRGQSIPTCPADQSRILLDGSLVSGTLDCVGGDFTRGDTDIARVCETGEVDIVLDAAPSTGFHVIQVFTDKGQLSNEMPVCVNMDCVCDSPPCPTI